jgi:hypothetical protein
MRLDCFSALFESMRPSFHVTLFRLALFSSCSSCGNISSQLQQFWLPNRLV